MPARPSWRPASIACRPDRRAHRLLVELAAELEEAPERDRSLAVVAVPGQKLAEVRWAPDRKRLGHPTLFIDASADPVITRVFKPDAEFHRLDVERNTGRVVQIHDNRMSRTALKEPGLVARVQAVLDRILPRYESPAVFLYKRDREAGTFKLPAHAKLGHLGHVRGLNDWEACDAVVIVGGYLPRIDVVERHAVVLARIGGLAVNPTGRFTEKLRGVRMRDGTSCGVFNRGHADPLVDAVLRAEQAEELVQAVDRIRAVRAQRPKDIFVLSPVVLDLTVDELVALDDLAETRLERLLARFGGLVPLSEGWSSVHPTCFPRGRRSRTGSGGI